MSTLQTPFKTIKVQCVVDEELVAGISNQNTVPIRECRDCGKEIR